MNYFIYFVIRIVIKLTIKYTTSIILDKIKYAINEYPYIKIYYFTLKFTTIIMSVKNKTCKIKYFINMKTRAR